MFLIKIILKPILLQSTRILKKTKYVICNKFWCIWYNFIAILWSDALRWTSEKSVNVLVGVVIIIISPNYPVMHLWGDDHERPGQRFVSPTNLLYIPSSLCSTLLGGMHYVEAHNVMSRLWWCPLIIILLVWATGYQTNRDWFQAKKPRHGNKLVSTKI